MSYMTYLQCPVVETQTDEYRWVFQLALLSRQVNMMDFIGPFNIHACTGYQCGKTSISAEEENDRDRCKDFE